MSLSVSEQLLEVEHEINSCAYCLSRAIGKLVPGAGDASSRIVLLGEAPGKQEVITGQPFIGRAGKLLRGTLAEAGIGKYFLTSAVKYLPEYVTPRPEDVSHGRKHLLRQLKIIQPKVLILLGKVACRSILDREVNMPHEHGTWVESDFGPCFISYHPAAPLYSPKLREVFIDDLKKLGKDL